MSYFYVLDGKTPMKCGSVTEWGAWFEGANRHVGIAEKGDITVSTVFLGIGHSYGGRAPLLFETMIFGGEHDEDQWRYSTWEEAEKGHAKACELAGV